MDVTCESCEVKFAQGAIHKGRPHREGGGGSPKADIVREVAWIYSYRSSQNADKGGEGVQNPENFADVLYVWSLRKRIVGEYIVKFPHHSN